MQAVEIIPGRYAVCFLKHPDGAKYSSIAAGSISYCIDDELVSCSLNCNLVVLVLVPWQPAGMGHTAAQQPQQLT